MDVGKVNVNDLMAESFMRLRLFGLTYILCIGGIFLCGCSQNVSVLDYRDSVDSKMKRARAKVNEGDIDAAIKLYRKVLNDKFRQARAHLDLALLLSDKNDYLNAICHYQRYLAMRPDTEKREMIEERLQSAIQSFIAIQTPDSSLRTSKRTNKNSSNNDFATTLQKLKRAEGSEKSLILRVAELEKANKKLVSKVEDCEGELDQYRAVIGLSSVERQVKPKSKPKPKQKKQIARTYRVRRGDTLSSIATDVYGDEKQWHRVLKANKGKLKGSQKIKIGQVLIIP